MTDDGVLSSSWCTNWGAYNTPRLWAMVSDEDSPDAWRQVAAWGEIAGAVKDHRARLVQARDALTAAWPPEQNGAAQAFVNELNTLIGRMDIARQDADTTATGLANILEALRTAKNQIQPLYEEYKDKSDDLVPAWWDHAEEDIDKKAQAHMITAEQIVQQNVPQLKVPDPYTMDPKGARGGYEPTGDGNTSGSSGTSSTSGRSRGTTDVGVPHDPVPPMPGHDATLPDGTGPSSPDGSFPDGTGGGGTGGGGAGGGSIGGGPGLAGVITPPPPGAPPVAPPGGLPPAGGGLPGGGGPVTGIAPVTGGPMPGLLPGGLGGGLGTGGAGTGGTGVSGLTGTTGAGGGYARGTRRAAGGAGRALPSGAVIGETVGGGGRGGAPGVGGVSGRGVSGSGVSERGGRAGARGAAKPKPPSWLPEDEPRGSAGRAGATTGPAGMAGAARRAGRRDGDPGDHFDPDNPWEVAEGVDPVITPSDDNPRHDPGPNVIGWRG